MPPFDLGLLPSELKPKRLARHTQLVLWAARQIKAEVEQLPKSPCIRLGLATSCASMISESGASRIQKGAMAASRHMVSQCPPHAASGAIAQFFNTSANVLTVSTVAPPGLDALGLPLKILFPVLTDSVVAGGR